MSGVSKTKLPGIRIKRKENRRNGVKCDEYITIRYRNTDGKLCEEGAGFASEKMTPELAYHLLGIIKKNIKTGLHPQSLKEMREMEVERQKKEEVNKQELKKKEMSICAFFTDKYKPYEALHKKAKTIAIEENIFNKWIKKKYGKLMIQEFTEEIIKEVMIHAKQSNLSTSSLRYLRTIISRMWEIAKENKLIAGENPTLSIKLPKLENQRTRFLTHDEAQLLLNTLWKRSVELHDFSIMTMFAGLRPSETSRLEVADLNFENHLIYIRRTKTSHPRYVVMTPEIVEVLERRLKTSPESMLVFPGRFGQQKTSVSRTFERVVEELGFNKYVNDPLQKIVFYSLRHTFASWLVQDGVPLLTISKLMGHSTTRMTERYAHLAQENLIEAAFHLTGKIKTKSFNSAEEFFYNEGLLCSNCYDFISPTEIHKRGIRSRERYLALFGAFCPRCRKIYPQCEWPRVRKVNMLEDIRKIISPVAA